MMKIYGIKTCGSVRKALKFMNNNGIEYEFIDFKKEPVGVAKIQEWLGHTSLDILLNTKGTKYKTLKLKELNLTDTQKIEWMAKENLIIKRPVIEYKNSVIVGFDETRFKELF
ncbi:MAG: Spx/MgsR family RNA polymerase-binding regulatory protein [Sulfurovaceae bacterium]